MSSPRVITSTLALLSLWTAGAGAAVPRVLVVLSKPDAPYVAVVDSMRKHLPAREAQTEIAVEKIDQFNAAAVQAHPPAVIVTVGVEAGRRVAQASPATPILHTLLPRSAALDLLRNGRGGKSGSQRDSAIFLDQPIGRQLDLIRLALPQHTRVAVVLGPATQPLAPELRDAARKRSLKIETATLSRRDEMLSVLDDLLDGADVLLSVADPLVYHSETIHHLLLTTYRYKIPVVGLSKAYVDAGALLAVYSTPENIGRQVSQIIASLPATGVATLPTPGYPRHYTVSVNRRVAASLDLVLEGEDVLLQKLEALSRP